MRIISFIVTLPVLWTLIFPQTVIAKETINTNTKINFEKKNNVKISDGFCSTEKYFSLDNYEGYEPVKTEEEIKREKILERWKKKQGKGNLPSGKFTINASAYTAAADECGKSDGITASGIKVQENRTLACPPQYPFGTKVKIDGYGTYVCEDRGGAIKGNKFDIYMETKVEAFQFGRRNLTAEVIG